MNYIVHHSDADGHASAMVVWKYLTQVCAQRDTEIRFYSTNYGLPFPSFVPGEGDKVFLVDFSYQPRARMEEFVQRVGPDRLVWIDHHATSMSYADEAPALKTLPGIRRVGTAACVLCWEHFFPGKEVPRILKLVGAWDTWDRSERTVRWADCLSLIAYLDSFDSRPFRAVKYWMDLFQEDRCDKALYHGSKFRRFRENIEGRVMRSCCFKGTFAGYRALMVNYSGNSLMFENIPGAERYALWVTFQMKRGGYWMVSLYGPKDSAVHCGNLARELGEAGPIPGGGGHARAAGFETTFEYFWSLVEMDDVADEPVTQNGD